MIELLLLQYYDFITFNVMRLKMAYTKTYKHTDIFKCRSYIMIFANTDSHLLIVFDISNLTHCPIDHSGYLQFNLALLFVYTKCSENVMEVYAVSTYF
jgi:hypothetical protein